MASSSSNKRRCSRENSSERSQDRISNLLDNILASQILSRLPTIEAVRTCVLSKRWVHLWTHITDLHFHGPFVRPNKYNSALYRVKKNKKGAKKSSFPNFVSMVLLHLTTFNIQNFYFYSYDDVEPSSLKAWIFAVVNRRVRNFTISHCHPLLSPPFQLPLSRTSEPRNNL